MDMSGQPLDLVLNFSQGTGKLVVGTDYPAVAAFQRAMEEGQLTGTWRYLLAHDFPTLPYTIIGTFVKTPKGRVLFFPGAAIAIETDDPTARFNGRRLGHITVDPPRTAKTSSHVAVQDLPHHESRGLKYRSAPPPDHMYPWFSFLLPDLSGFAALPAQLVVRFPPPPGNLHDFGQRLLADGAFATVPLPPPAGPGPVYVQFDVWLGRGASWKTLKARPLAWAYKPEIVKDAPAHKQDVTVNRVDIGLGPEIGLAVLVLRPSGRLLRPRILRPTLSR